MRNTTEQPVTLLPMTTAPQARSRNFLALRTAVMVAPFALTSLAFAADETVAFDVSGVKGPVFTILGVGVAISIGFAIYKLGKRGTAKL